jgi:hypothetical protein
VAEKVSNGDVVLVDRRSQGWISESIKLGSKLRYGWLSPHTRYCHAAIVYDAADQNAIRIAEATAGGVVHLSFLSKYASANYEVIHTNVDRCDWIEVKTFLDCVIEARTEYGYLTYAGLTLYALTGTRLCLQEAGTATCSGLVCDALTRAGVVWRRPPYACTPADISAQLQPAGPSRPPPRRAREPARPHPRPDVRAALADLRRTALARRAVARPGPAND